MSRDIQLIALMSFLVTGADLESSKLTFVCLSGSSLVRIEVTGLDQNFSAVDAGVPVVLRGLCFRDVGYGLQATFGSRGSFVVEDPCNLAEKWASVELLENLPLRLACGAAAQAISVGVLVVCCIFVYFEVSFVLAVLLGWFACRRVALPGVILILVLLFGCCFQGGIADLRGRAEQIVAGEKGYFKLSNVALQSVPVKYGACYYSACGQRVGNGSRLCLRELDEDGCGTVTAGRGNEVNCVCVCVLSN